jgi:predicted permease
MHTAWLLIPDLALIALGLLLRQGFFREQAFWAGLERLVYFVLFPSLLFITTARQTFEPGTAAPVLAGALGAAASGVAMGHAARALLKPDSLLFSSGVQCAFRFNSYLLLALSQRIGGAEGLGLAALIMGVSIPLLNVAAVYPLARQAGGSLGRELARNPLILATVGGLAANLAGLTIPQPALATLDRLGTASLALALLASGAGLQLKSSFTARPELRRSAWQLTLWFTTVKLVLMPLAALGLSAWLGLDGLARAIVVLYASMPSSPAAYILASRMGGDGAFVAWLLSLSLIGSALALPIWLSLAGV